MTEPRWRAGDIDSATARNPLVSILIPCRNAEAWIEECVQSAIAQTYKNLEIILLDDGSTDRSIEAVRRFEKRMRIVQVAPGGVGLARNRLLQLSSGTWINFLDADDYLLPDKIAEQLSVTDEGTSVVYSPPFVLESSRLRLSNHGSAPGSCLHGPSPSNYTDIFAKFFEWTAFQTSALLFKRSSVVDVGGWNELEPICHEHELILRLLFAGKGFCSHPKAMSVYRRTNTHSLSRADAISTIKGRMKLSDLLEERLLASQQLTEERCTALSEARLGMARAAYQIDRTFAQALGRQAVNHGPLAVQRSSKVYTHLFRYFGLDIAEKVAQMHRNLVRIFRRRWRD